MKIYELFIGLIICIIGIIFMVITDRCWNEIQQKNQQIIQLETKIDSLSHSFERYVVVVGDTTLQVIRDIKIGKESKKVLDIRTIHKGKKIYYFELNERTGLYLIKNKY